MNNNEIKNYLIDCIGLDDKEVEEIKKDYSNRLIEYLTDEQLEECQAFNK